MMTPDQESVRNGTTTIGISAILATFSCQSEHLNHDFDQNIGSNLLCSEDFSIFERPISEILETLRYSFFLDCATEPESSMGCHELAWMRVLWFHHCRMLPKEYDDVRLRLHPDMSMPLKTFVVSSMHGVSSRI